MERIRQDQLNRLPPCSLNFNSQLAGLKNSLGLWEDMINKTSKLSASLKTVIQCIGGFLEAFQKIADCAYGSNCGLKDLGSSMTRFCLRERGLESRLRTFNSQLTECLTAPLIDRLEEWKRSVAQLDRENGKEWRRAKSELQRATCELEKLSKRSRRKGSSTSSYAIGSVDSNSHNEIYAFSTPQSNDSKNHNGIVLHSGDNMHLNFVQHDLILKRQTLAELERVSLRRAVVEERRRFAELLTCLKPVLDSKLAIFGDVSLFEESIRAIITHSLYDPNQIPNDIEEAIDYAVGHVTSNLLSDRKYSSSLSSSSFASGSRSESRCTIRSAKHSSTTTTTTMGNGLDYANNTTSLSCHASELSLQSAISVSTNGSWNNHHHNHNGSGSNYSQSTIHASQQHCDVLLNSAQNSNTTDNHLSHTTGGVGDSVSLFENPDGSISGESGSLGRPMPNSVLDSINPDWIPLPGLSNKNHLPVNEHQSTMPPHSTTVFGYSREQLNNPDDENVVSHNDGINHGDQTTTEVDDDDDADGGGGGGGGAGGGGTTTEDTEDGETDDEKLDHNNDSSSSGTHLDQPQKPQVLYPNQAIPSPVYTNLNELKKAAARKFQNRNSPTVNTIQSKGETLQNIDNNSSLYTSRKFSLQLNNNNNNESMLTPTGLGESFHVSDINNKLNSDLSQSSSHFIWPPITTLDSVHSSDYRMSEINSPSIIQSSMYPSTTSVTAIATLPSNGNTHNTTTNNNMSSLSDATQSSTFDNNNNNDIGYINTIVNSGTSTFRRRQSEYFKKSLDSTLSNGGVCSSPPPPIAPLPIAPSSLSPSSSIGKNSNNYASVTPGLIRRGSQAYQQTPQTGTRHYDRPVIHPPRRSSSVSRELVSHNSVLNNNSTVNKNSNNANQSLLTTNQHQHYSRLNLSDFAGNKNPSLFNSSSYEQSTTTNTTYNNNSSINNNDNNFHHQHYQQQPQHLQHHQSNLLQRINSNGSVASSVMQQQQQHPYRQQQQQQDMFPLPCSPSTMNNNNSHYSRIYQNNHNNNGIMMTGRDSPIPVSHINNNNNLSSNTTNNTTSNSNSSQLMFGVKVLPNIVTSQQLLNNNTAVNSQHYHQQHQSRLPQRGGLTRQTSCEPPAIGSLMNHHNTTIGGGGGGLLRSQTLFPPDRQSSSSSVSNEEYMQHPQHQHQQSQSHYSSNIHNLRQNSSFLQSRQPTSSDSGGGPTVRGQPPPQQQLFTDDSVTSFIE